MHTLREAWEYAQPATMQTFYQLLGAQVPINTRATFVPYEMAALAEYVQHQVAGGSCLTALDRHLLAVCCAGTSTRAVAAAIRTRTSVPVDADCVRYYRNVLMFGTPVHFSEFRSHAAASCQAGARQNVGAHCRAEGLIVAALYELLDQVSDQGSFLAFVRELHRDASQSHWDHGRTEQFLAAALAWAESTDMGRDVGLPEALSWRAFAAFLYCGKIYV